ncbi:NAD(P)-binding protein [Aspergillus pseudoustus]|uniref:NAD(P)-binding protein n=1 Tax=Aspergillus pseudoustus TaxID=1810923 RepID=A0ABR4IV22_9EURO
MPAITNPTALILVTGANGFLGTWIVRQLLEKGHRVRAAVRSMDKGLYLRELFESHSGNLELVIIGDMTEAGAFANAVRNVDGIIHTASPVTTFADDPNEVIQPAMKGVIGILESARDHGARVSRIVVTSSSAAIMDTEDEEITVSELDWNDRRVQECEALGRQASGLSKYSASKTLAERAAWEYVQRNRGEIAWDLTAINPPYIFGPTIHNVETPASLNSSSKRFYNALVNNDFDGVQPMERPGHGWVDERDVAAAHIKALETPDAGGERIIVSAGEWVWQDIINTALSLPNSIYRPHREVTGPEEVKRRFITFSPDKRERILGLKLRSMEECVGDILVDFAGRGVVSLSGLAGTADVKLRSFRDQG